MAELFPNVTFYMGQSPRLAMVDSSVLTNITIQDILDTCRAYEDDIDQSDDPALIAGFGKQPLGGGTKVGITVVCNDLLWGFSAHNTVDSSGSATSADAVGRILIDTSAQFETDGIKPGAIIWNDTDGSAATVLRVDSEIQITHWPLEGGTENDWDIADNYRIWNILTCYIRGGNLTAIDSVGAEMDPILGTFATQVNYTASASATLQEELSIQYSAFDRAVAVDVLSSHEGVEYPVGTGLAPVNNMPDALSIDQTRGFKRFRVRGDLELTSEDYSDGYIFEGEAQHLSTFTIQPGAVVQNCEFHNACIEGTLDGNNTLLGCCVSSLNYVNGMIDRCALESTITLGGGVQASFIDCYSDVTGLGTPVIDMGGSGQSLSIRNYNGAIKLQNKSGSESVSLDLNSGEVVIDSSVTAGTIVVRGIGAVTDNSSGATVVDQTVTGALNRTLGLLHENSYVDNTTYDASKNLLTARVRCFDTKANANAAKDGGSETTGLIATYSITAEHSEAMDNYRMVRDV
jgi:hypothetical protein